MLSSFDDMIEIDMSEESSMVTLENLGPGSFYRVQFHISVFEGELTM